MPRYLCVRQRKLVGVGSHLPSCESWDQIQVTRHGSSSVYAVEKLEKALTFSVEDTMTVKPGPQTAYQIAKGLVQQTHKVPQQKLGDMLAQTI